MTLWKGGCKKIRVSKNPERRIDNTAKRATRRYGMSAKHNKNANTKKRRGMVFLTAILAIAMIIPQAALATQPGADLEISGGGGAGKFSL
jgi:hypothetical protein